jgi:hypothetical protein
LEVAVERDEGFDATVSLRMLWNPPGVSAGTANVPKNESSAALSLSARSNAPTRTWPITVVGTARVGGVTRAVSSAIVPLEVSAPWVEATIGRVRVEQGGSAELEIALARKRDFEGQYTVEIARLPRGVTAEFPTVGPEATAAVVPLKVDPNASPGRHRSQYLRLRVPTPAGEVLHYVRGGEIRIDRPLPARQEGGSE